MDSQKALRQIREYQSMISNAEREILRLTKIVLPEGEIATWLHGNYERYGVVSDHFGYSRVNRILIQSESGKEYWIDASKVLRNL